MNISVMSDNPHSRRFVKVANNKLITRGESIPLAIKLQCFEQMVIKVETTEGYHTKTMNCDHLESNPEVSETFITRMSSLVKEVGVYTDYDRLAAEIAQPLSEDFIEDDELRVDYLKYFDLNEAISTDISKVGYDEEIIFNLKQIKDKNFNLIQLNFKYG